MQSRPLVALWLGRVEIYTWSSVFNIAYQQNYLANIFFTPPINAAAL